MKCIVYNNHIRYIIKTPNIVGTQVPMDPSSNSYGKNETKGFLHSSDFKDYKFTAVNGYEVCKKRELEGKRRGEKTKQEIV